MLRSWIFIILFAALALASYGAENPEQDVVSRQKQLFDVIIRKDFGKLDAFLAPGYIGTYSLGIIDRKKELEDLRQFPLASYEISNTKVSFPTVDTAIMAFHLHVRVVVNSKDIFEDDNVTCVWTRSGGKWLLASQTAVKGPQGS